MFEVQSDSSNVVKRYGRERDAIVAAEAASKVTPDAVISVLRFDTGARLGVVIWQTPEAS